MNRSIWNRTYGGVGGRQGKPGLLTDLIASGLTADRARTLLNTHDGNLRAALPALPAAS